MIKRQFYSLEHRSRDYEASSSSSEDESPSSKEDEEDASSSADECDEQHEASSPVHPSSDNEGDRMEENQDSQNLFFSGQWKSHDVDGSNNVEEDSSKDNGIQKQERPSSSLSNQWADLVAETLNDGAAEFSDDCVIRCKNVFKCRLCPKTVCLASETMQAHLVSKKHARSLLHFQEGKLKIMLNSDGEEEEQGETHAERHARVVASLKEAAVEEEPQKKRSSGRQRQRKRAKKKVQLEKSEQVTMQNEQRTVPVMKKEPSVPADVGHKRKHALGPKTPKEGMKKTQDKSLKRKKVKHVREKRPKLAV